MTDPLMEEVVGLPVAVPRCTA